MARVRILVDAHTVLLDFANRHGFVADDTEAATRAELFRLHGVLGSN